MSKRRTKANIVGLDIGSRCIKAVELDDQGRILWASIRNIEPLVYHRSEVINRGVLVPALTDLLSRRQNPKMRIAVAFPSMHLQMRITHIGINRSQEDCTPTEVDLKYNFLLDNAEVLAAGEILGFDNDRGSARVLQTVVRSETVEELTILIKDAGFNPEVVSSPVFTLPEVFPDLLVKKSISIFLDAGFESTKLVMYKNGEPFGQRYMRIGLADLHNAGDSSEILRESEQKIENASSDELDDVSTWRDYLGRIIEGVESALDDFETSMTGVSIMRVGGGGSRIEAFINGLTEHFYGRFEVATAIPRTRKGDMNSEVPGELLCNAASLAVWEGV